MLSPAPPAVLATVAETSSGTYWRRAWDLSIEFDGATSDRESFAVNQCIGDFPVSRFEDSAEGLARDVHFPGGLFLIHTFEVG
jgi:hypothetical protein